MALLTNANAHEAMEFVKGDMIDRKNTEVVVEF